MATKYENLYQSILEGDMGEATALTQALIDEGVEAEELLNEGLIAPMEEVGKLFEEGEYFVPEMLISARAMQGALNLVRPLLVASDVQPSGTVVIGTVKGDMHDIGKNLVSMMIEGAGFEIVDLGVDVSPEKFVEAIKDSGANLVGLSALLTTTLPMMVDTIEAIKAAGLRDQVKIIIGGAPTTPEFAAQIGADGHARDASRAAALANEMVS